MSSSNKDYALRANEAPFDALGRIVSHETMVTAATLRDGKIDLPARVHESRKRFKEVRALLRLFRSPLGEVQFLAENHWYRDTAREIADYRDADAVVAAVTGLPRKVKQRLGFKTMHRLRRVTTQEHHAIYHDAASAQARVENIAAQLPAAAARTSALVPTAFGEFASIEKGLVRTLRDGKRAMRDAYRSGEAAAFHEWRKRVKDHWYHMQLLESVWPKRLARRAGRLEKLSRILGDHHDLEVIRGIVATAESAFTPVEALHVDSILEARQHQLERKA